MSTATIESTPFVTTPTAASTATLAVKWDHFGQLRRFSIPNTDDGDLYKALMEKVYALRPDFQDGLAWTDEEGDLIFLLSTDELKEAIALSKAGQLKVFSMGGVEKERDDHKVVVIDHDEDEEQESGNEVQPIYQFMPRCQQRECHRSREAHDRSRSRSGGRSHSRRSSHSSSQLTSCDYSSDESLASRKMKMRMAKSFKEGNKKEAKMTMKTMRHNRPPFAMRFKSQCPKMEKKFAHHPLHPKLAKKLGLHGHTMNHTYRYHTMNPAMMMRFMSPGRHPFFHERRHHPWTPHDHRRPPPPPSMMPEHFQFQMPPPPPHPGMDRRHRQMPPPFPMVDLSDMAGYARMHRSRHMQPSSPFPMDPREMGGCGRGMGRRGMDLRRMGMRGFGMGCRGRHF